MYDSLIIDSASYVMHWIMYNHISLVVNILLDKLVYRSSLYSLMKHNLPDKRKLNGTNTRMVLHPLIAIYQSLSPAKNTIIVNVTVQ